MRRLITLYPPEISKILDSNRLTIIRAIDPHLPDEFKLGSKLWVREKWYPMRVDYKNLGSLAPILYSDGYIKNRDYWSIKYNNDIPPMGHSWKSPVTMPHWASRITLEITDISTKTLYDIPEEDLLATGIKMDSDFGSLCVDIEDNTYWPNDLPGGSAVKAVFGEFWDSINIRKGLYWYKANHHVWIIKAKRV